MTEEPFKDQPAEEILDEDVAEYIDDDVASEEGDAGPAGDQGAAPATGHPAVDEVLRSLDALGETPVDEHVAVFEQAHDQLRRTLSSGANDDPA